MEPWNEFAARHRGVPTWHRIVEERYNGDEDRAVVAFLEYEMDSCEADYVRQRMLGGITHVMLGVLYSLIRDIQRDIAKIMDKMEIES